MTRSGSPCPCVNTLMNAISFELCTGHYCLLLRATPLRADVQHCADTRDAHAQLGQDLRQARVGTHKRSHDTRYRRCWCAHTDGHGPGDITHSHGAVSRGLTVVAANEAVAILVLQLGVDVLFRLLHRDVHEAVQARQHACRRTAATPTLQHSKRASATRSESASGVPAAAHTCSQQQQRCRHTTEQNSASKATARAKGGWPRRGAASTGRRSPLYSTPELSLTITGRPMTDLRNSLGFLPAFAPSAIWTAAQQDAREAAAVADADADAAAIAPAQPASETHTTRQQRRR